MLDSLVEPEREERAQAEKLMGQLLEGEYAAVGPSTAPLTVVVFSDFQCPYCKKMRALLAAEPLVAPAGRVRLVFRHMPMALHEWAKSGGSGGLCAASKRRRVLAAPRRPVREPGRDYGIQRRSKGRRSGLASRNAEYPRFQGLSTSPDLPGHGPSRPTPRNACRREGYTHAVHKRRVHGRTARRCGVAPAVGGGVGRGACAGGIEEMRYFMNRRGNGTRIVCGLQPPRAEEPRETFSANTISKYVRRSELMKRIAQIVLI